MHSSHYRLFAGAIVLTIMLAGCSPHSERWGVILWLQNDAIAPSGTVVPIIASSQLKNSFTIRPSEDLHPVELEQWRLEAFRRQRDAAAFAADYAPFRDLYGVSQLDKLRVRERPDAGAVQLYKLRKGEVIKILSREEKQKTIGDYTGYWYEVLTSGGIRGYTFGEYLQIKTLAQLAEVQPGKTADAFLELFFHSTFRPDYYREMRKTGRYDLSRFLPGYGLFPDRENHRINIVTEEHATTIEYTNITRPTKDSYAFEGSSLILTRVTENWINLIYSDNGVRYSEDYVYFPEDIETLVTGEMERREKLLDRLLEAGTTLESSAYGTLQLHEDGSFLWTGFDHLVPEIVSSEATGNGVIEFPLFLDDEAATRFDGAVTFRFARKDSATEKDTVRFVYTFGDGSVRFTFVPESAVDGNIVQNGSLSPIVLFFTYM